MEEAIGVVRILDIKVFVHLKEFNIINSCAYLSTDQYSRSFFYSRSYTK
jgi:hypothetical protein